MRAHRGKHKNQIPIQDKKNSHEYRLDTREIKSQLNETPVNSVVGIRMIREDLKKNTK